MYHDGESPHVASGPILAGIIASKSFQFNASRLEIRLDVVKKANSRMVASSEERRITKKQVWTDLQTGTRDCLYIPLFCALSLCRLTN